MSCPDAAERDGSGSASKASPPDRRFPRSCRLTARSQFTLVYEKGRRAGSACFTMFAVPNTLGHTRLGVTVTRKVGNAVSRNRIKRVLRDVFRRHRDSLKGALDIVVNARASAATAPTPEIEEQFLKVFADLARRIRG